MCVHEPWAPPPLRGPLEPREPREHHAHHAPAVPPLAAVYLRASAHAPLAEKLGELAAALPPCKQVSPGSPTDWPTGNDDRRIVDESDLDSICIGRPNVAGHKCTPEAPANRQVELKFGASSDKGGCGMMEDAHSMHAPADAAYAICCVYDGHGGKSAAEFCKEHLHTNVTSSTAFLEGNIQAALREGFRKTEAHLLADQREAMRRSFMPTGDSVAQKTCASNLGIEGDDFSPGVANCCGTTALVALVMGSSLHVAWVGDCRAILCRGGTAVPLTCDHCIESSLAEAARVVAAGAEVDGGRLGGFLAVTRALGDLDSVTGCKPLGLSSEPDLRSELLRPEDEFLLLASDGLFGVVSSEDAVRLAREELRVYNDAGMASEKLVEVALKRHADDNVTALIVSLNPVAPAERPAHRRLFLQKRRDLPEPLKQEHVPSSQ